MRERFEHFLELVMMEGMDVVEHDQRRHFDLIAFPIDSDPLDGIERRIGSRCVLRKIAKLGRSQTGTNRIDCPLNGKGPVTNPLRGEAADLL